MLDLKGFELISSLFEQTAGCPHVHYQDSSWMQNLTMIDIDTPVKGSLDDAPESESEYGNED